MLWVLVAVPLVAGAALLLTGGRADRWAPAVALPAAAVTLALTVTAAVTRPSVSAPFLAGMPFGLRVDGLSAVLVVLVGVVLLAVLVFGAGEFGPAEARARLCGFLLLFADAMLVTVTATSLPTLLLAWEIMGATSYALIGFWWQDADRARSGTIAFLTTRAADLGLYLAAGAALAGGATALALDELGTLPAGWRDLAAAGVLLAAFGKSAQLPFSFWLSRAMAGPSPVSALLHSATMVAAGAYLLLRLQPLLAATGWAAALTLWAGLLTALALGAVAVVQRDLKQLLAASTCAQVGFMVMAAGAGGVAAGTAQLTAHAVTKSMLFLAAGAWLTALGTQELPLLRAAARGDPVVGLSFTVGAVTLAGLPPLSLWAAKDAVLASVLHTSVPLYLLGLAATALSAGYAGRALALVWSPPDDGPAPAPEGSRRVRRWQVAPLPPLAAGAALGGALALPPVWHAFGDTVDAAATPEPTGAELATSAAIALLAAAAAAAAVRRRGDLPSSPALAGWLGLEHAARRAVVLPADVAATLLARFDDRLVDGGVRAVSRAGLASARLTGARLEPTVDAAVRGVARGGRWLGGLARRPQTGQLHQYYAQAVVALAVLALLLIVL